MNPRLPAVALALATLNLIGCGPAPVPPDTAAPPTPADVLLLREIRDSLKQKG